MQAQPVDERDVGQEVNVDIYRVVFWDMQRGGGVSSAYNLSRVEHVADVLTWVRQQIGPDGPHAGSHPEIGAVLGKTRRHSFG